MPEFLEVLDSVQSSANAIRALFESDGTRPIRGGARTNTVQYKTKLAAAAKLVEGLLTGRVPAYRFQEVMTTSDFPFLFGDILDRSVMASYVEWPSFWDGIARRAVVNDFRDVKIFPPVYGADGPLDTVGQAAEYPLARVYEQEPITYHVEKYGRVVPFSWESMINDDLDQLKDTPVRLGRGARRTENTNVTREYVGTSGPNTTLYTTANHNIVNITNGATSNNPPLSIDGIADALLVLNNMVDETGEPILREMVTLVVPPALEVVAKNLMNALQVWVTQAKAGGVPDNASGSGFQQLNINNWLTNNLTLRINPYIPRVATVANGNTSWYLFANPSSSREAIRIAFLRGHETPELWMKSPNAVRIGGGAADPMDGDFETDSIEYKIRHVTGTVQVDGKATVMSNGSGS